MACARERASQVSSGCARDTVQGMIKGIFLDSMVMLTSG